MPDLPIPADLLDTVTEYLDDIGRGNSHPEASDLRTRLRAAMERADTLNDYTVIGTYADNGQRFATWTRATDAEEAERKAADEADGEVIIAGVLSGYLTMLR